MQLVIRRYRENNVWYNFRINARMVIDATETGLIDTYKLRTVSLTEGNFGRDLRRSALLSLPVFLFLSLLVNPLINFSPIMSMYVLSIIFIYAQIREAVLVGDLLTGRDFKARSFINLLEKEYEIRKMSDVFAHVVANSQTWQEPEVIELAPVPLLTIIKA
jgi:hypothetical protein